MLLETMCAIPAKTQEWVWKQVIPEGQLTLLMGQPGVGKSMLAMDLIARVTNGQRDLSGAEQGPPADVMLVSGEDDFASVVRPRLVDAGADLGFVNVAITASIGMFEPDKFEPDLRPEDLAMESLEECLGDFQRMNLPCRLIVIDPINWFLDAAGCHSDDQIREMLARLAELAMKSGTAILLVANLSVFDKGKRGRLSGTTPALAEAARSVWSIICDPGQPRRRMLLSVKTNLCETPPGLAFTIQDGRICWEEESVAQSAAQFLAEAADHQQLQNLAEQSELTRATDWLKRRLAEGPVYSNELKADAAANDFSEKTFRRALIVLDCRKGKEKKKANGQWFWRLPTSIKDPATNVPPVSNTTNVAQASNTRFVEDRTLAETVAETAGASDSSSEQPESWPSSPSSISQKPYQTGNLANSCELGELFCESMS